MRKAKTEGIKSINFPHRKPAVFNEIHPCGVDDIPLCGMISSHCSDDIAAAMGGFYIISGVSLMHPIYHPNLFGYHRAPHDIIILVPRMPPLVARGGAERSEAEGIKVLIMSISPQSADGCQLPLQQGEPFFIHRNQIAKTSKNHEKYTKKSRLSKSVLFVRRVLCSDYNTNIKNIKG